MAFLSIYPMTECNSGAPYLSQAYKKTEKLFPSDLLFQEAFSHTVLL